MKSRLFYPTIVLILLLLPSFASAQNATNTTNTTVIIDPRVIEDVENGTAVRVMVWLHENPKQKEYTSEEHRSETDRVNREIMENVKEIQDKVLPTLSQSDFNLTHEFKLIYAFAGYVTKEGLNKLKNNSYVKEIYGSYDVSTTSDSEENATKDNTTNTIYNTTTVWYTPEIIDVFDNKVERPAILDNNTHVGVGIYIKDNSNITVTGTKEERRALSRQIFDWCEPVTRAILASLSEDEFIIHSGRDLEPLWCSFSGRLTRKGFEKLLADERVSQIHLSQLYTLYGGDGGQTGESEETESGNETLPEPPQVEIEPEPAPLPEAEPEPVEVEPELSWFGRLIQFLKSLLGLN